MPIDIKTITLLLLLGTQVQAKELIPETIVKAEVVSVRDGDTVEIMAYPWPDFNPTTAIRLSGIDTPELRGKCKEESEKALKAKEYLESVLTKEVTLKNVRYGKYAGRHVAEIITSNGINVSEALIEAGHARYYNGRKRQPWCKKDI